MASEGDAFEALEGEVDYPMYVVTAACGGSIASFAQSSEAARSAGGSAGHGLHSPKPVAIRVQ
jgi:hypothetical protein